MVRYINLIAVLFGSILFSACQLDAETSRPILLAQNTSTPTASATATASPPATATPPHTPPPPPPPPPPPTPPPPPPPPPRLRLETAQRAFAGGNYPVAHTEFEALLSDPGAELHEKRLALYWRGRSELEMEDTAAAIASLKMFVQQYPSHQLTRPAQFNLGRAYEQSARPQEAVQAYLGVIIPDDPVNVYIYERIGDIWLETGAYTQTVASYQTGIESTTDPSFQVHLREGIAQAELLLNNNPAGAITQYEEILEIAKIDSYRAKILRLLGQTQIAANNTQAGHERYLEAVDNYPQAYNSYLALVELVNADVPVDDFQRGLVDYYADAYQPAIAAFEAYLAQPTPAPISATHTLTASHTAPKIASPQLTPPPRAAEALWYIGLSKQALGRYNSAIITLQQLIDEHPNNENWGQAHLEIGKTLIDQGSHERAKSVLRSFAAQNPTHPLAPEALWRAGRLDMRNEQYAEAHRHLTALAETHPTSQYAAEALYWAGQATLQLKNYEQAIAAWTKLTQDYPTSTLYSFAGYWRARTLQILGRDQAAQSVLAELVDQPADYYVLRARDLLAGQTPHTVPLALPSKAELAREQAKAESWLQQWLELPEAGSLSAVGERIKEDPAFQRGATLLSFGLRSEALVEFEQLKNNWWDDALAMYQLALYFQEQQLGQLSIVSAARVIFLSPAGTPEEVPIFIQRLYYPIYFADLIFAEAEAQQVDPALLLAIMRQESLFELSAESFVGARGLMQVMPTTGEYIAERGGFENFSTDQLWLPYMSIKMGAWYINQQLGIFDDNQFAALAAYNAGPGHVLEWIKTSDDLDIFVESIPFLESRLYIRRIYVNLAAYRRLYGPPAEDGQP